MKKMLTGPPAATLTKREVAEQLRLSERTVHTLIRSGLLPTIRFKGSVRIMRTDLEAFLEKQRVKARAESTHSEQQPPQKIGPLGGWVASGSRAHLDIVQRLRELCGPGGGTQ